MAKCAGRRVACRRVKLADSLEAIPLCPRSTCHYSCSSSNNNSNLNLSRTRKPSSPWFSLIMNATRTRPVASQVIMVTVFTFPPPSHRPPPSLLILSNGTNNKKKMGDECFQPKWKTCLDTSEILKPCSSCLNCFEKGI